MKILSVAAPKKDDPGSLHSAKSTIFVDDMDKATCLSWTIAGEFIIAGFDSGNLVKYDVETGKEVQRLKCHTERVNRVNMNREKTMLITASKDCTAKLIDPINFEMVKTYKTERPVNGAAISPTHPHILLGGGQDGIL